MGPCLAAGSGVRSPCMDRWHPLQRANGTGSLQQPHGQHGLGISTPKTKRQRPKASGTVPRPVPRAAVPG